MKKLEELISIVGSDKVAAIGTSAVRSVSRVGLGVAVARMGDPESFARFVLFMAIETIVSTVVNAVVTTPLITLSSGAGTDEAAALDGVARIRARQLAVLGSCGGAVAAAVLTSAPPAEIASFAGFLWLSALATPAQGSLTAAFRSRLVFASETAFAGAAACTLAIAVLSGSAGGTMTWMACASGAAARLAMLAKRKRATATTTETTVDAKAAARMTTIAKPMVIGSLGVTASSRAQPFVLQAMLGPLDVAAFGAAQTLAGPIRLFSGSMSGVLRPRLGLHARRGDGSAFVRALLLAIVPIVLLGGVLAATAAAGGEKVLRLIFGAGFESAAACFAALTVYATLEAVGACSAVAVQSLSEAGTVAVTKARLAVAAVSLALLVPAALWGGTVGSAWALAATEGVFVLLTVKLAWTAGCRTFTFAIPDAAPATR